jgi:hypothetical protein
MQPNPTLMTEGRRMETLREAASLEWKGVRCARCDAHRMWPGQLPILVVAVDEDLLVDPVQAVRNQAKSYHYHDEAGQDEQDFVKDQGDNAD